MMNRTGFRLCVVLWAAVGPGLTHAQDRSFMFSGGATVVGLTPTDSRIGDDRTLSADLYIERGDPRGQWLIYVEGNSSLDPGGVSTQLPEVNADAGSALDADRNGRIQISELNYRFERDGRSRITIGLLDPSGYLDRTRITNDENVQFLGASFVNNPTIEFPDYTVGAAYEKAGDARRPQVSAVISSASGLADNPNLSYSQLLQLSDDDDGAFAAVGLGWLTERRLIRVGAWLNTRPHSSIQADKPDEDNYGVYLVLGQSWQEHAFNMRLGLANTDVSIGAEFLAFAYRYRWRNHAVGAGIARTILSRQVLDPGLDNSQHVEIFGRFNFREDIHMTVSLQRIRHSGFIALKADPRDSATVFGLRFHYRFP